MPVLENAIRDVIGTGQPWDLSLRFLWSEPGECCKHLPGSLIMINGIMPKSISINTIRRRRRPGAGRPPVGPFVGARLPQELIDKIDAWASRECNGSRSEAIRRLVELGLAAGEPSAPKRVRGK